MNKEKHKNLMIDLLKYINDEANDFILKGGTALYLCYNLDRFSTDIDLDSNRSLSNILQRYCKNKNYELACKKDTQSVQRFSLHYDDSEYLKIEISHREKNNIYSIVEINGINTYDIDNLFSMKLSAGLNRTKIRDLYDICFIYNNYKDRINKNNIILLDSFIHEKGVEYFDYLLKNQENDELIDKKKFEEYYLKLIYDLQK